MVDEFLLKSVGRQVPERTVLVDAMFDDEGPDHEQPVVDLAGHAELKVILVAEGHTDS